MFTYILHHYNDHRVNYSFAFYDRSIACARHKLQHSTEAFWTVKFKPLISHPTLKIFAIKKRKILLPADLDCTIIPTFLECLFNNTQIPMSTNDHSTMLEE